MQLGMGMGLGFNAMRGGGAPVGPVTAIIYGQSELEYLLNADSAYRQITQPTPGDGNLVVFTQSGDGVAPVRTTVNATSVAAGEVNPTMAAWSALFAHLRPGRQFVVGDGAVPGTGRPSLHNTSDADDRLWSDFTSVVGAMETEFGTVGNVVECWYNSDAAFVENFRNAFWPSYFGTNGDGTAFTLGATNAVTSQVVATCLWDGSAALTEKGRGLFTRSGTRWHILTPMPFCDSPVDPTPELTRFTDGKRLEEPARAVMHGLTDDTLAQSVNLMVGPSAHVANFGDGIHPLTDDPDGQILLGWPLAIALLRASGMTINEPTVTGIEGASDGSYADLVVDLPNGGTLTTLRTFRGTAMPATPSPHQQAVTGIEVSRIGGARRPMFLTAETGYPVAHRGTVAIIDSGSGSPRRGRVRITPTNAFVFGDALSYLRGQATAMLQEPRDPSNKLYLDHLIEHVPGLYDSDATYPLEGIAVRPFQSDIAVPVTAPAFAARGAYFDASSKYFGDNISVAGSNAGAMSFWIRQDTTWASGMTAFELRVGPTQKLVASTAGSGRMSFRLTQDGTGSDIFTTATNRFFADAWHHVLWAWDYDAERFQLYVNDVAQTTTSYSFAGSTTLEINDTVTQIGVGGPVSGTGQPGSLAHLWVSLDQTLDFSLEANRAKFALAGEPVDLGPNGSIPTGTTPHWYYDGIAPAWGNHGTVGNVDLIGTLGTPATAPEY